MGLSNLEKLQGSISGFATCGVIPKRINWWGLGVSDWEVARKPQGQEAKVESRVWTLAFLNVVSKPETSGNEASQGTGV